MMINSVKTAKLLKIFLAVILKKFFNQDGSSNTNTYRDLSYTMSHQMRGQNQAGQRQTCRKVYRDFVIGLIQNDLQMLPQTKEVILAIFAGTSETDDAFLNSLAANCVKISTEKLGWNPEKIVVESVRLVLASYKVLAMQPDEFMDIFVSVSLKHGTEMKKYLDWLETQTKE